MELKIYNPQEDGFLQSIDWNFDELKAEITKKSEAYMNLVYSNEQMKEAKKDRANLRKFVTALEDKRKEIKKQILVPYSDFETKEKELVGIVNQAIENIDTQVKGYEEGLRQEKLAKVKEIYVEEIKDLDRTIPFEKVYKESWLNASTTLKSIREEISSIYAKVDADLKILNADTSPYVFEMKEEYLKNFDLTAALAKKQKLEETAKKKAAFEEQKKQREAEQQERLLKEANEVECAGRIDETVSEASDVTDQKQSKKKRKRITIAITANEDQFDYLNQVLIELRSHAENVEMLSKEEF